MPEEAEAQSISKKFPGMPLVLLLALAGLAVSLILEYHHTALIFHFQTGPSFCSWNERFDCDAVSQSSYAQFFGLSVSGLAAVFYIVLLGFASFASPAPTFPARAYSNVLLFLAITAFVPSAYLALISFAVLKKLCVLCLTLDAINLVFLFSALNLSARAGRGAPVPARAADGAIRVARFVLAPSKPIEPVRTLSLLASSAVIFLFMAIQFLPSFLVENVFRTQEVKANELMTRQRAVADWLGAARGDVPIHLGGSAAENDFARGDPSSPITLVVFSDFECPFCRKLAHSLETLAPRYAFRAVFKNFPLDQACNSLIDHKFHQSSCRAAEMARCAGEQGEEMFWRAHDQLFTGDELQPETISNLPELIHADAAAIGECVAKGAALERVKQDISEGEKLRIQATPTVFVNGRFVRFPTTEVLEDIFRSIRAR